MFIFTHSLGSNRFHRAVRRRFSAASAAFALAIALGASSLPAVANAKGKFHLEEATIADIQQAIQAKELTSTQLLKLYLARIKAYNGLGVEEPEGLLGK